MARFTSYSSKAKPTDSDTLLINDASSSSNKQVSFTAVLGWVKDKLGSSTIDGLDTTSKNVVGAINELKEDLDNIEGGGGSGDGLTSEVKDALLAIFQHVAYADSSGQTYYDALEEALYPTVTTRTVSYSLSHVTSSNNASTVTSGASYASTLTASSGYTINTVTVTMGGADVTSTVYSSGTITIPSVTGNIVITATAVASVSSISAVYTQSGTVYTNTNLDSLKSDLVVTASYTGGSTSVISSSDYTLSGSLTEGTSTITVGYGGKTATFTVTVSALTYVQDGLVMWLDGEKNGTDGAHETTLTTWVDQTGNGWDWTNYGATVGEKSVIFADRAHLNRNKDDLPQNVAMMEIVLKYSNTGTSMAVLTGFGRDVVGNITISVSTGLLVFHTGTEQGVNTAYAITNGVIHTANSAGYLDGESAELATSAADWQYKYPCIGVYRGSSGSATQYPFVGEIYCIRLYNRVLTEQEILHNASIDMQRFGIGA